MAKPSLSKKGKKFKWPGESGAGRHTIDYKTHQGRMPYNPLNSPYQTNAQFDSAVNTTANEQLQPRLDDLGRRENLETRSHTGRANDITSMYNFGTKARQDAMTAASNALNSLITSNSSADEGTKAAMMAALRSGQDRETAVANQLGVAAIPDGGQAYTDATQSRNDIGGLGLTGQFSSILGGLGRDVGISEVGRTEANRNEGARWDAIQSGINDERTQLNDELPGLREQARQNLSATELNRQGQRVQQKLAGEQQQLAVDQFGEQKIQDKSQRSLSRRQQREAERAGRRGARQANRQQSETERSNRANESINRDQVEAQKAQYVADAQKAGDDATRTALEAKSKRFDAGVKILTDYFQPTKGETAKSGKARKAFEQRVTNGYDAMVTQLASATGAGPVEVRQMIMAAVNTQTPWGARWVARARREISIEKANRLKARTGVDPRNPTGSPLGPK